MIGSQSRPKLHADIAHPISVGSRRDRSRVEVVDAYRDEVATQPAAGVCRSVA